MNTIKLEGLLIQEVTLRWQLCQYYIAVVSNDVGCTCDYYEDIDYR